MKLIQPIGIDPVKGYRFGKSRRGTPRMCSQLYLIDGLLIDTGHVHMRSDILDILSNHRIDQIVLTHHHEDHSGNINHVIRQHDAPAFASAQTIELMKDPPKISFAQHLSWGKYEPSDQLKPISKRVETDHYSFDVIPVPGHATDMIALHEPDEGWLFAGDLYVYHRIKYFMTPESMAEQINSLRRVIALNFEYLFCGHHPKHERGKEKLQKKLQFLEDFYGQVKHHYEQGLSARAIMKEIQLKESWSSYILTGGTITAINMVESVIRDEQIRLSKSPK